MAGGTPSWGTDLTADGSAVLPSYGSGDAGKVLKVNGLGDGTLWDYIEAGDVASEITSDCASAVAGSAIYNALHQRAMYEELAHVAFTGSYNDLLDKPVAGSVVPVHSHFASDIVSLDVAISSVAVPLASGIASEVVEETVSGIVSGIAEGIASTVVSDSVHDATITIMQGGVEKGVFSLNQSVDSTISLEIGSGSIDSSVLSSIALKADIMDLAHVAFTGSYNDLADKPTVDSSIDSASVNPVQNRQIWSAISGILSRLDALEQRLQ